MKIISAVFLLFGFTHVNAKSRPNYTFSGYVEDSVSGVRLSGATILINELNIVAYSNTNGF